MYIFLKKLLENFVKRMIFIVFLQSEHLDLGKVYSSSYCYKLFIMYYFLDIDKEYKKADGHTMNSMTTFLEKHKDVIFGNNKHLRGYSGDRDSFQLNITHNFESLPLNENTNKDNQLWRERFVYIYFLFNLD